MKELKRGLVIQGLMMFLLALIGLMKKNKLIPKKQAILYGILGMASIAASSYVNKDLRINNNLQLGKRKK